MENANEIREVFRNSRFDYYEFLSSRGVKERLIECTMCGQATLFEEARWDKTQELPFCSDKCLQVDYEILDDYALMDYLEDIEDSLNPKEHNKEE